jgi:hypothetical protein
VFSAGRALRDVAAMANVPHPTGSPANARVRDQLVARLTALGLAPRVQRSESHDTLVFRGRGQTASLVSGANVENVIGVWPGRDRRLPALALMAHYDSVPGSPGAADDMAGVATILELVRTLKTQGTPARDVLVIFTDGEEEGLLGARAFFTADPLVRRVGFVVNMDTRGGGGKASLFETGPGDGAAISIYGATARRPASTSLAVFIYKLLPNDTDFTVAKAAGIGGFNYAFIGRQFDYHSPSSTAATLDAGSVQHLGDEVLGTARALASSPVLPARTLDVVYGDILGLGVIAYPPAVGWVFLAVVAALIALGAWRADRITPLAWRDVFKGLGATVIILIGEALVLHLVRHATGVGFGWMEQRPILARFSLFEIAMIAGGLGAILAAASALAGGRTSLAGTWTGLLLSALLAALVLQKIAPTTALVIAWPLAAAALASALTAAGLSPRWAPRAVALVVTVLAVAWVGGLLHALMQGLDLPEAPVPALWMITVLIWPLAWPARPPRPWRHVPGAAAMVIGLALALGMQATSPWTARHPDAAEPLYMVDPAGGKAWRASPIALDAWSRAVLAADGGRISRTVLPGLSEPITAAPAKTVAVTPPAITLTHDANGTVSLHAAMAADAALRLDLSADMTVSGARVNGKPTPILIQPGQ